MTEKKQLKARAKYKQSINRNRYKPLMTEAMYNQETAQEDLPVNQAYKGYVVNQVFDTATIYIDTENKTAIAEVRFHNTQLMIRESTTGALIDQSNMETVFLTFVENEKRYVVNEMSRVALTRIGQSSRENTYDGLPNTVNSEEK